MVLRQATYVLNSWTKYTKKWEHPILRSKACLKNPAASGGPKPSQSPVPGPASPCLIGRGNILKLPAGQSPLDYLYTAEWEEDGKQQSATTALTAAMKPLTAQTGRYDALCQSRQSCVVQIQENQLMVGDQAIPIGAISSWKKIGPGENRYGTFVAINTWLSLFTPQAAETAATGLKRNGFSTYSAAYVITYSTPTNSSNQISIGFVNQSVSRFFESELLATLNLPEALESRPAVQGKDLPPPAAGDSDRR